MQLRRVRIYIYIYTIVWTDNYNDNHYHTCLCINGKTAKHLYYIYIIKHIRFKNDKTFVTKKNNCLSCVIERLYMFIVINDIFYSIIEEVLFLI